MRISVRTFLLVALVLIGASSGALGFAGPVADPLSSPGSPPPMPSLSSDSSSTDDAPGPYELSYRCPSGVEDSASTQTVRAQCPFRILDDSDSLGSPILAVHPFDPSQMAIGSLHGGGEVDGLTPRTRDTGSGGSGVFTIMTSEDGGFSWIDKPTRSSTAPERAQGWGEHAALAIDSEGRLYAAGSFSEPVGNALCESRPPSPPCENVYDNYTMRLLLWKWDTVNRNIDWGGYSSSTETSFIEVEPIVEPVYYDWLSVTYLPLRDSPLFQEPVYEQPVSGNPWANQTVSTTPEPDAARPEQPYEEAVVATWLERSPEPDQLLDGKASRLRAAWTSVYNTNHWEMLPLNMTVGPCSSISNGVAWDGGVYVACVVEDGDAYNHRARAKTGQIDLWKIVPSESRAELVSETPLRGGNPRLTASADGRFALVTLDRLSSTDLDVSAAFSWFGEDRWRALEGLSSSLQSDAGDIVEARIQGMAYMVESRMLHLIYQEVYPPVGINLSAAEPPKTAQFQKHLVALNECLGIQAVYDLEVGLVHQYSPVTQSGLDFGLFNDLHDTFAVVPLAGGGQREFVAFGDMGVLRFGELVEANAPPCPPEPAPRVAVGGGLMAADIPATASSITAQQVALGVGGGVVSLAMLARLLAIRRSKLVELPTGMKK